MSFMYTELTIKDAVNKAVRFFKEESNSPEFCEQTLIAILKEVYVVSREDVHKGESSSLLRMKTINPHIF